MGRIKREEYGSACYHVCARGNNRRYIFERDEAKTAFLSIISRYQTRMGIRVHALVVMGNHFHLLLSISEKHGLSKVMQKLLLSFSHWYRRNEAYVGYVWQGRFSSRLIKNEKQLIANIDYIHANPVRANMVADPLSYRWSTARVWLGGSRPLVDFEGIKISGFEEIGASSLGSLSMSES